MAHEANVNEDEFDGRLVTLERQIGGALKLLEDLEGIVKAVDTRTGNITREAEAFKQETRDVIQKSVHKWMGYAEDAEKRWRDQAQARDVAGEVAKFETRISERVMEQVKREVGGAIGALEHRIRGFLLEVIKPMGWRVGVAKALRSIAGVMDPRLPGGE